MIKTPPMYKIAVLILSFTSIILNACTTSKGQSFSGEPNVLTSKEKGEGWELLFDGKSTNGWHTYNKDFAGENWTVVDGAIVLDPKIKDSRGNGDLVTDNSYENFEFSTEWKISEAGSSGIIFDIK